MNDPFPAGEPSKDLEPHELGLARRFEALTRHDAPGAVRDALRAEPSREAAQRGRVLRLVPLGGWGLASAALLLLAIGAAAFVELTDPITPATQVAAGEGEVQDLTIVEDARLALFHAVETFDDVGLAPGSLIADWGR